MSLKTVSTVQRQKEQEKLKDEAVNKCVDCNYKMKQPG